MGPLCITANGLPTWQRWVIFDRSGQSCLLVHVRFVLKADLSLARQAKGASTRPKIRASEAQLVCDGEDVFVVFHGTRIAERGRPGTPEAMQWAMLQPGWTVSSSPVHNEITLWHDGISRDRSAGATS